MMTLRIRLATPDDYEALAMICNAAYSDRAGQPVVPASADDMRAEDEDRDPTCRAGRWVAVRGDAVLGACEYTQDAARYHPQKFWADVYVHPDHQRQDIGSAVYNYLIAALHPLDPISARCGIREDMTRGVAFLKQRGWYEQMRTWESFLDLTTFDRMPFEAAEARLHAAGIEIKTLAELRDGPDHARKLYELVWEVRQDMPDPDPPVRETFETFVTTRLNNAAVAPEAYFVAVHDGTYAGISYYRVNPDDKDRLRTAQTSVARAYRLRGIALALKVHGIAWAQAEGYRAIRTTNESNNRAILSINERLGYVKRPAWLDMVKVFKGGAP